MEKILGHDLNKQQWLICQLPEKYYGFGLRSGMLISGAQQVMSLLKCELEMASHSEDLNLIECVNNRRNLG